MLSAGVQSPERLCLVFFFLYFFGHRCKECRIAAPGQGIKPMPLAVEVRSPNHWTTREVPVPRCFQSPAQPLSGPATPPCSDPSPTLDLPSRPSESLTRGLGKETHREGVLGHQTGLGVHLTRPLASCHPCLLVCGAQSPAWDLRLSPVLSGPQRTHL